MRIRQVFNLEPARLVTDKDPLPFRPLARSSFDQLLVHKPWLDRTILFVLGGTAVTATTTRPGQYTARVTLLVNQPGT